MSLISIDQARAHVRVEDDYPVEQLQSAVDGAQDAAQAYLNRRIYESKDALDADRVEYPAAVGAAASSRDSALAAAVFIQDAEERSAAIRLARVVYQEAIADAGRCVNGVVVNPSIRSAILLTMGHLYANRSDVVVGAHVMELPQGARSLLRPYRRVMMP
jgi:hypothetical protein